MVPQLPQVSGGSPKNSVGLGRKLQQPQKLNFPAYGQSAPSTASGMSVHGAGDTGPEGDGGAMPVSNATWWVPQESGEEGQDGKEFTRELQGEIHLPSRLQPSCPFPLFNISVSFRLTSICSVLTIVLVPCRALGPRRTGFGITRGQRRVWQKSGMLRQFTKKESVRFTGCRNYYGFEGR
jgi:hypothetical protein